MKKKIAISIGLLICTYIAFKVFNTSKTDKPLPSTASTAPPLLPVSTSTPASISDSTPTQPLTLIPSSNLTSITQVKEQKIPKIFIINLDRTPKRFEFIKKQLDPYKLEYERFSAIDGYKIEFKNVKTGKLLTPEQKKDFYKFSWNHKPCKYDVLLNNNRLIQLFIKKAKFSLGEIGVTCSHRAIWKLMIERNYEQVIVFEDDVILENNFKENLQKFLADLPEDWDIAFLGVGRRNNKYEYFVSVGEIFRDLDNIEGHPFVAKIQPTNLTYGMYGYVINQKGAKKLLQLTDFSDMPLDDIVFQNGGINTGKVKGYVSMKKLLEPKLNDSEIKRMGRSY